MAEASASSYKSKTQMDSTVSNNVVSAHQQLRDDEDEKKNERITDEGKEEGGRTRSLNDEACTIIHEIFGNDEVVVDRHKKKQKKYRSLESIYMATMPVIIVEDDKARIVNKIPM